MKLQSLLLVGLSSVALLAVACGDDDPAPAGPATGKGGASAGAAGSTSQGGAGGGTGGAPVGTGGTGGALAGGSAGAPAGGAGGSGPARKQGAVAIGQSVTEAAMMKFISASASAQFAEVSGPTPTSNIQCTTTTEGACTYLECVTDSAGSGGAAGAPAITYLSAGDITATGLKTEVKLLFKDATTGYTPFTGMALLYEGGETVTITGAGAAVPKFVGTLVAPVTVKFAKPVVPAPPAKLDIDPANPLEVVWDVDAKVKVNAGIVASATVGTKTTSSIVSCIFEGSALRGEVPKALLAKLPKGDASFFVSESSTAKVVAGDYDVNLTVNGGASLFASSTVK